MTEQEFEQVAADCEGQATGREERARQDAEAERAWDVEAARAEVWNWMWARTAGSDRAKAEAAEALDALIAVAAQRG